jgi:hypothetical protein
MMQPKVSSALKKAMTKGLKKAAINHAYDSVSSRDEDDKDKGVKYARKEKRHGKKVARAEGNLAVKKAKAKKAKAKVAKLKGHTQVDKDIKKYKRNAFMKESELGRKTKKVPSVKKNAYESNSEISKRISDKKVITKF